MLAIRFMATSFSESEYAKRSIFFRPATMTLLAALTIKAFNAHVKKEPVKKLFWNPTEGFPSIEA